jgi:hypothetical protein
MGRFTELLEAGERPLWLDATDYAGRLLANGAIPWFDLAAFIAWHGKAHALLRPDVVALPLAPLTAAWLAAHPALADAMKAKRRSVWPLKTLLADDAFRRHAEELLRALRASHEQLPLALVLPSPRHWLAGAYVAAHGAAPEAGEDEIDSAAMYLADFLRTFGNAGLDAILLEEDARSEPRSLAEVGWYQPVLNVAAHFRWDAGLHLPVAADYPGGEAGFDFIVAPRVIAGQASGVVPDSGFWQGEAVPAADFFLVRIPGDAEPETVLERLALLR